MGAPGAQHPLELKLPDGWDAKSPVVEKLRALATEKKLDAPTTQALLDLHAAEAQAREASLVQTFNGWNEALKTDKEFGGQAFEANAQIARKSMVKFATPELQQLLEETGFGSHPELVRFAYRVGKALGEDSMAGTGGGIRPTPKTENDLLRERYPNSPELFSSKES